MVKEGIEKRLADSIENVLTLANGLMTVDVIGGEPIQFSESFSCPDCGISIDVYKRQDYGFRLPSAKDNRPLNFEEFEGKIDQMLFVSATPNVYEEDVYKRQA